MAPLAVPLPVNAYAAAAAVGDPRMPFPCAESRRVVLEDRARLTPVSVFEVACTDVRSRLHDSPRQALDRRISADRSPRAGRETMGCPSVAGAAGITWSALRGTSIIRRIHLTARRVGGSAVGEPTDE